ncbi:MAG TPA: LemA family protein [Candidatus Methanoperedenaceae archaeon]|nr:LemA family protein [Candidatus Methanoperedenaceae archaeon]
MSNKTYIAIGILLLLFVVPVLWYVSTYNSLVSKDNDVEAKWQQVEVQYQRRMDLIPNLVNTVKGYAGFEQKVLTDVTELRSRWQGATTKEGKISAAGEFETALGRLIAVAENYPDLKANQNFLALQDELANTENKIAVERQRYNEAVRDYNIAIASIPTKFVASNMGITKKPYFEAKTGAEEPPQVNISI